MCDSDGEIFVLARVRLWSDPSQSSVPWSPIRRGLVRLHDSEQGIGSNAPSHDLKDVSEGLVHVRHELLGRCFRAAWPLSGSFLVLLGAEDSTKTQPRLPSQINYQSTQIVDRVKTHREQSHHSALDE